MTLVLLKQQGWSPIGVSLKLAKWNSPKNSCKENACCTEESFRIAKEVCEKLNVPYYIYDVSKEFEKNVMDYFIDELKNNRTPNPCVVCNRKVKYKYLFKWANEHGIQHVATGHYAKVEKKGSIFQLKLAKDTLKDQTYGLSMFPQEWLKFVRTPLGNYTKEEVYKLAKKNGFEIFQKLKQSQDLCFVSNKSLDLFIEDKLKIKKGDIINLQGKKLGEHKGLHFYTIGQTKKLNLPGKYYVKSFNTKENQIIVTNKLDEVKSQKEIILEPYNFTIKAPKTPIQVTAKIRYGEFVKGTATLYPPNNGKLLITFDEPKHAVTPGQFCVFYKDDVCLGGGVITANGEQRLAIIQPATNDQRSSNQQPATSNNPTSNPLPTQVITSESKKRKKKVFTMDFVLKNKQFFSQEVKKGKIFIYPTDTLYGLGCDATNEKAVEKIREIKNRDQKPFLIIAPNINWIENNTSFNHKLELNKLPGPYSFIVNIKPNIVANSVLMKSKTIGVRIPSSDIIKILKVPFISTSVNFSGQSPAITLKDIPKEIKSKVDYIIKSNKPLLGKPSTIIDLTKNKPLILR